MLKNEEFYNIVNQFIDTDEINSLIYKEPYTVICLIKYAFDELVANIIEQQFDIQDGKEEFGKYSVLLSKKLSKELRPKMAELSILLGITPFSRPIVFSDAKRIYTKFLLIIKDLTRD